MKQKKTTVTSRIQSFKHAISGLVAVFKEEPNAKIHLIAAVLVLLFGFYFKIATHEWIIVSFCIAFVITMEVINTAIEHLADVISPTWHPLVKKAKDMAAGAVLVASITALIIGLLIFLPKI